MRLKSQNTKDNDLIITSLVDNFCPETLKNQIQN